MLTHPTRQRRLTLGATAAAVSLLFSFVIITDRPFVGEEAASPAGIVKILALNSRRVCLLDDLPTDGVHGSHGTGMPD